MKYEIEIDGLPDGYEPAEKGFYNGGLMIITISLRRKVRKYDWSKTLDEVLVISNNGHIYPNDGIRPRELYTGWQPNIHGNCPVDPGACIVRVKDTDGNLYEDIAEAIDWAAENAYCWQFVRLAEGYEW